MNEAVTKISIFNKIQDSIKKNYKLAISLIVILILSLGIIQYYLIYKNKQVLKSSIDYNNLKSNNFDSSFEGTIKKVLSQKNFYSILLSLENIPNKINDGEINSAYQNYLVLLNDKKIKDLYKSAIAIHGSYNFLNEIDVTSIDQDSYNDLSEKIENLLSYINPSLKSYIGFKLEILFLLSVADQDLSGNKLISDNTVNLYKQIIDNNDISTLIKDRIQKVYDFQKYK